jgi:hypothetical protein
MPNIAISTAFWRKKSIIFFLRKAGDVVALTAQLRLIACDLSYELVNILKNLFAI